MRNNKSIVFGENAPPVVSAPKVGRLFYGVLLFVIAIGIVFRFSHLGGKVYWHDEVYTGFFSTGHSPVAALHDLFTGEIITAGQVQSFQTYSGIKQIFLSGINLAMHDPQHPPLYYMLSALMMQFCRDTVLATRLVAAIAGVALIPAIYFGSIAVSGS
ncbi:MAG: hypothetical protein AAGC93_28715 [Cyanobacteria bacterium P01_F01_bin.53]